MNNPSSFDNREDYPHLESLDDRTGSPLVKLIAVISALALAIALLLGFLFLRKRQGDQLSAAQRAEQAAHAVAPAQAQIFQDEVKLKGSDAVVGGTVRNISADPLESLSVEIALKGRGSQVSQTKSVPVSPGSLRPGEEGKYSLQISSSQWSGAQVVRLRSETQKTDIPFKPEVGEKRPPEKTPEGKVVIEQRPRRKGDDFLNTPDTPIRIP